MMNKLVVVAALGLYACNPPAPEVHITPPAPAAPVPAAGVPGTFTVVGTATLEVEPERAELLVTVSSTAARPGEATKAARAKQAKLMKSLGALGIEEQDIRLSHLAITQLWDYERQRVTGYQASIQVTASTKDFDELGPMMDAAADAGATNMSSSFVADLVPLKKKVREMALAAAREKAEQMTQALGVTLGKVTALGENTGAGWMYYGENGLANAVDLVPSKLVSSTTGTLQPLTLSVSVTYTLGSG